MAATTGHQGLYFSLISETYLNMYLKTPGSTLKELSTKIEQFTCNENQLQEKYAMNIKVMHLVEDIVHASLVMCFGPNCLIDISQEDIIQFRRCVSQISDDIGHTPFFNEKIADRCLDVLHDMKNLDHAVRII